MTNHSGKAIASVLSEIKAEDKLEAYQALSKVLMTKDGRDPRTRKFASGITYLAQFMAHDLILTVRSAQKNVPFENLMHRPLMLDSLYGVGPESAPHLYKSESPGDLRTHFRVGTLGRRFLADVPGPDVSRALLPSDQLTRGEALLADRRNDSHTILAQITAVWMLFHNHVFDRLRVFGSTPDALPLRFVMTQNVLRATWHNILRNDVLPHILHPDVREDKKFHDGGSFDPATSMPPADARIALRCLHTLPLPNYLFAREENALDLADMLDIGSERKITQADALWKIEWDLFFDVDPEKPTALNRTAYEVKFANGLTTASDQNLFSADLLRSLKILDKGEKKPKKRAKQTRDILEPDAKEKLLDHIENLIRGSILPGPELEKIIGILREHLPLQILLLAEAEEESEGRYLGLAGSAMLAPWLMGALESAEGSTSDDDRLRGHVKSRFVDILKTLNLLK